MTASRFPHPLTLLVACILLAAALSWVLPAGEYQRREDPATGRSAVVPGTYAPVEAAPVGPFQALVGIPRGMIAAASVIFFVFLVGARSRWWSVPARSAGWSTRSRPHSRGGDCW